MDWLELVLDLERPGRRSAARKPPTYAAGTIVQVPPRELRERGLELRPEPELAGDLLDVPVVL